MFETKFNGYVAGRRRHFLDMGGDTTVVQAAPAPDTSALANASAESARIGAELGNRQIDVANQQFDRTMKTAQPVIDAQLELMNQTKTQGDEYFNYWKDKAQPVENALNADAMAAGSDQKQQEAVDRAVADTQGSFTRNINQVMRQGKRYGASINPTADLSALGLEQARMTAGNATGARDKEKALGFAKKMDVAGLYRGMPGASQGAYSVANASGNSAVGNAMAPGAALQSGMAAGAGTTMGGRGLQQSGLGSVLGNQTSYAGMATNANIANANAQAQSDAGMGQLLGTIGGIAGRFAFSSKRLKENGRTIDGESVLEKVENLPVEEWDYKDGVADSGTHVGPYAEDVQREFGDKAAPGGKMLDLVTMNGLNLAALKEVASKIGRIEHRLGMAGA